MKVYFLQITLLLALPSAVFLHQKHTAPERDKVLNRSYDFELFTGTNSSSSYANCGGCACKALCFGAHHCAEVLECKFGGQMFTGAKKFRFICECPRYFKGQCCQQQMCLGDSELVNGSCVCRYPVYQRGRHCERALCEHGGRSHEGFCRSCLYPWTGLFCEKLMCFNEGRLKTSVDGTQLCVCNRGFAGRSCEVSLDAKTRGSACTVLFAESRCAYFGEATLVAIFMILVGMVLLLSTFIYRGWATRVRNGQFSAWAQNHPIQQTLLTNEAGLKMAASRFV